MTRKSGQSKSKTESTDETLTPSKRSRRLSTRRKKDGTESESEIEETVLESKTPKRASRRPEKKITDIEEKSEESGDESTTASKSSNGIADIPSSRRRSRRSSRSEDVQAETKSRSSRKPKQKEEEEKIEEKSENEEEKDNGTAVSGGEEKNGQEEQSQSENEKDENTDEEGNSDVREEKEEEERRGEESSSDEESVRKSTVTVVRDKSPQEEEEEEEGEKEEAAAEEEEKEDEGDKASSEGEEPVDREEGEIEGSPPPIWTGEQRTWGVCKPYSKYKFSRVRDPNISTSVLKELNTSVKPLHRDILDTSTQDIPAAESSEVEEEEVEQEVAAAAMDASEPEGHKREEKERRSRETEDENENPNVKKRERRREEEMEKEEEKEMKVARKVSIKKDRRLSPRRSKPALTPTNVLFIYNLTRPFTLGQLRELLSRTGKIVADGFWIDAIKSKCYVEYENEEQAEETRHALHEVRWPVTNDKVLKVEFTTKDAMLAAQIKAETIEQPISRKTDPLTLDRNSQRIAVREWDMGKPSFEMEEKSRDRREADKDRRKRKERRHSDSADTEQLEPRRKKRDIEAPAKLLDDLFRKTKALPCLYWLPLTAEQIAVKEEMRKKHLAELEKRMKGVGARPSRERRGRRS